MDLNDDDYHDWRHVEYMGVSICPRGSLRNVAASVRERVESRKRHHHCRHHCHCCHRCYQSLPSSPLSSISSKCLLHQTTRTSSYCAPRLGQDEKCDVYDNPCNGPHKLLWRFKKFIGWRAENKDIIEYSEADKYLWKAAKRQQVVATSAKSTSFSLTQYLALLDVQNWRLSCSEESLQNSFNLADLMSRSILALEAVEIKSVF